MSNNNKNKETQPPAFTNIFKMQNTSNNNNNNPSNMRSKPIPTNNSILSKYNNTNRHTIVFSAQENVEQLYHNLRLETLTSDSSNSFKQDESTSNQNSSPLSKTPDSSGDIGNWIDVPDSGLGSSGLGAGDSVGTIGDSDDHDMGESNNQSINHDESDSADEESTKKYKINQLAIAAEDNTTKRLKTFVATTLSNEKAYLNKLARLLSFKKYLEENYSGSFNELSVLFSDIVQIYKIHDVVALKLQDYLDSFSDLQQRQLSDSKLNDNNALIKETFLSSALQLLANIMEISFPVYLEFVQNYPRSLSILNKLEKQAVSTGLLSKRKSFIDCQADFNNKLLNTNNKLKRNILSSPTKFKSVKDEFNLYASDSKKNEDKIDTAKLFSEEILLRPTILFMLINSLKEECILAAQDLPPSSSNALKTNIKSMFDNETSKKLRDKVFEQIKLNRMPKEARKHEDVVELCERNNERKLRHLILYGDCLVCCRLKKEKRQLKWVIPIDKLEIFLDDYKSAKSEIELRHLREEVVSLRGDLKKEENTSTRSQLKIKKKLAEHENELTLQSSRLKLIVRSNPVPTTVLTSSYSSNNQQQQISTKTNLHLFSNNHLASSMNNLTVSHSNQTSRNNNFLTLNGTTYNSNTNTNHSTIQSQFISNSHLEQYIFLFTSDFERIAWLNEINSAIYAFKTRKTVVSIQNSDIEARINALKKIEEPPKVVTGSCTGSLELLIKQIDELPQANRVFVAVELKSCGSYLQVAQTKCTETTTTPVWNEKFTLELQCVDSLRIIFYCQTTGKALAISSQELKIDSNVNLNKLNCVKLSNGVVIQLAMKFLSPKKTITRRRTRNRNDLFGANLAELLQREKTTIPRILKDCVEVIETKGIEEVGIYRVSSVVSEVQKMKDLYSKNPNIALSDLRLKSPHLSANVLKLYLRELPEPLFTTLLYHRFMSALECSVPEFRSVELLRIFNELPDVNKTIILFILTHLLNIASKSDKNMMGLQNLCTLFGPTLMKLSPKDNLQADDMAKEIKESMQQAQVLFYVLKLHEEDRLIMEHKEQLNQLSTSSSASTLVNNSMLSSTYLDKNNNNINKNHLVSQQQDKDGLTNIANSKSFFKNIHTAL